MTAAPASAVIVCWTVGDRSTGVSLSITPKTARRSEEAVVTARREIAFSVPWFDPDRASAKVAPTSSWPNGGACC